jgi:O-antigen ligase
VRRWEVRVPSGATTALVLIGLATSFVSILVAYGAPSKLALFELRPLLSYLLVFPIVSGIRSLRDLEVGVAAYLGATAVASVITVWRYAHGEGGVASYTNGAVRVVESVLFTSALLAILWIMVLAPTVKRGAGLFALAALAVLSLTALLFTFQRTGWVALLVVVGLLFLTRIGQGVRLRLLLRALPVLIFGVIVIGAVNARASHSVNDPLRAVVTRLASVADFNRDVSGQHRIHEWKAAAHEIKEHPLAGIGLGHTITYWTPMYSPETHLMGGMTTTWYIHNSYVWFALKIGLIGACAFVGLLVLQLVRARASLRTISDPRRRRIILGALATLFALLIVSFTGPQLNEDFSTPYIAAIIALIELAPVIAIGSRRAPQTRSKTT